MMSSALDMALVAPFVLEHNRYSGGKQHVRAVKAHESTEREERSPQYIYKKLTTKKHLIRTYRRSLCVCRRSQSKVVSCQDVLNYASELNTLDASQSRNENQ